MNIELEQLLSFIKNENDTKTLSITEAYNIFFMYLKEFKRHETYMYHFSYYRVVKKFFDMNKVEYTNQITNELIIKFIQWERQQGNKNTTINKKIGSIKYMLNYLYKKGLISKPNITIEKLENDEKRFEVIDQDTIQKIINLVKSYNTHDYLLIMLLITTGIRRTELAMIKLSDINLKNRCILLSHTKNGKPRNIFIMEDLIEPIQKQINSNRIYLFEDTEHKDHVNPANICNVLKRIKRDLKIDHLSPHMFRHTYATALLDNGADFESIRLLLGHSDYSMIMRYVHIKQKKLAEISTSYNPYKKA